MRRLGAFLLPVVLAACSATAVPPTVAVTPSVCPTLTLVNAYLAAREQFNGDAGAALFTADGYIQSPNSAPQAPGTVAKFVGFDEIKTLIANTHPNVRSLKEVQVTRRPQGCNSPFAFGQRNVPANPGPSTDLDGTVTIRDGKIISVVYVFSP